MSRHYSRDRLGRFASAGTRVSSAAKAASKIGTSKARNAYVSGSFTKNLEVGQGGDYKGVKMGAEFRSPKGRGAIVKGIVGYHGKPDRRIDVTPTLNKPAKKVTVTASKRSAAGRKVKR